MIRAACRAGCAAGSCCGWRGRWSADSYQGSRVISRLRRGTARVDLRASIFCTVREPVLHPLCGFYAAAFTRLLALSISTPRPRWSPAGAPAKPTCVLQIAMPNGHRPEAVA